MYVTIESDVVIVPRFLPGMCSVQLWEHSTEAQTFWSGLPKPTKRRRVASASVEMVEDGDADVIEDGNDEAGDDVYNEHEMYGVPRIANELEDERLRADDSESEAAPEDLGLDRRGPFGPCLYRMSTDRLARFT